MHAHIHIIVSLSKKKLICSSYETHTSHLGSNPDVPFFILFFLITYSASVIGGLATVSFKEPWYSLLTRPNFNPPDWIFAPVWTTLYLMMTIAIWKFWHDKNRDMNTVYIYFIHLIFNTTWSIVFFVFHKMVLGAQQQYRFQVRQSYF